MNATTAVHAAPRPAWYMIAAIAALLWNLLGVAMFAMQYTLSPEALDALPAEQQSLYAAMPGWTWVAYAVAVGAGALGSLMLVLHRRAATWLLLGVVPALGLPAFILAVAALLYWFARRAAARGWLR